MLYKFIDSVNVAMADAESEASRTHTWLETEVLSYWQGAIRKRQENVSRCKEAVRMKTLFKDATGSRQSAVDEQKALAIAVKQLEEAEHKLVATKQYTRRLQKEIEVYKGSVQRLATTVQADLPTGAALLDGLIIKLEEYLAVKPVGAESSQSDEWSTATTSAGEALPSMARAESDEPEDEQKKQEPPKPES